MYNFTFHVPTKVFFGDGAVSNVAGEIQKFGRRVLFCYGGGSIKRNGIYNDVVRELKSAGIAYFEHAGISPNPTLAQVRAGIAKAKEHACDFILGVGGGSVIDCVKAISAGVSNNIDAWELILKPENISAALPVGVVLTMAATGSEMDCFGVISNTDTKEKLGFGSPLVLPKFAIMDPKYTFSVPKHQTAAGIADIMSHVFENYFSLNDGAYLQNRFAEAVLKTCIHYGPIAYREPENREARANLLWANSWAINGLLNSGKNTAWSVHPMEHELSAFYDITHGVGLAILTPRWMEYVLDDTTVGSFADFAENVWNITSGDPMQKAKEAIQRTYQFFELLEIPMHLRDVGIGEEHLQEMAKAAIAHKGGAIAGFKTLDVSDVLEIYRRSL